MSTWGELKTRVQNKYKGSTGATMLTQIGAAINDAVEYYQREQMWFSEGTASVTLTAGNPEVTTATGFPADFWYLHPDSGLAVVHSQTRYVLDKASVSQYDNWNLQGNGRPFIYRELAGGIQVYYYPDQAYMVEFRYIKKYPALTSENSTNDWLTNVPQLIEARALSMLFLSEGHDGQTMKNFWETEESKQFNSLRLSNHQRVATGNLALDGVFQ